MKKIICFLFIFLLTIFINGCFNNSNKVTNNSINNKVVSVEDYTIYDVEDAIMIASEKASSSVVAIMESSLSSQSLGSAVVCKRVPYANDEIVSEDAANITHYEYFAITNEHVVNGIMSFQYRVFISDRISDPSYQTSNVTVIEKDEDLDLAIIKFKSSVYIEIATIKNSNGLKKGQIVIAIGTPMSIDYFNTITHGVISHPYRYTKFDDFGGYYIQHDASINPGNSGGGLFNVEGKLIGINTWKLEGDETVFGMGFAIPSSVIYTKYSKYIESYE